MKTAEPVIYYTRQSEKTAFLQFSRFNVLRHLAGTSSREPEQHSHTLRRGDCTKSKRHLETEDRFFSAIQIITNA